MVTNTATNVVAGDIIGAPVQTHAFPSRQAPYVPTDLTDDGERPLAIEETGDGADRPITATEHRPESAGLRECRLDCGDVHNPR